MDIKDGKLLYHLTHIENLDSIIKYGLLSRKMACDLIAMDVADSEILEERQFNRLDDFVLFHFYPNTAFDNAVRYKHGAENFIYITVYRTYAESNGFQIVPRHPLNGSFERCNYKEGMKKIDWEIMEKPMKEIESDDQPHAKQVKMAECISEEPINPNDFAYIYCNERHVNELQHKYPELAAKIKEGVWLNGN
ncbi:TPA: DarT ssDNA thymidine ADP-ribosyltransferase family protein [Streptococcus suis]